MTAQGANSPLQTWDSISDLVNKKDTDGKTYRIPCSWQMYGVMEVKAESLEEAIEKAHSDSRALPTNSAYVEASFEVDTEIVEDYNQEDCL